MSASPTSDVRVTAFLHAKSGEEQAVQQAAEACVAPTRAEPGNTMYVLHRDKMDPSLFVFVEHWQSQQALDDHMQTPHFKQLKQTLDDILAMPMIVHILSPLG